MYKSLSLVFASVLTLAPFAALGDLQVFPLRVVLSDKDRSAQVSVRHRGQKAMRYRITTIFYQMQPDGTMKPLEKVSSSDNPADTYFRYSPKQVFLEPNVEQVVRLMMRAPADLPEGEYRTHLHFEGMDEVDDKKEASGAPEAQMQLKARLAVAIPIVIRKGNPSVKVSLQGLKLTKTADQKPAFSVQLTKEGNAIAYGDFEIISISSSGETKVIGTVNGVSSYIDSRLVSFPLSEAPFIPGKMKVTFKKSVSEGAAVMASSETDLR